VLTAALKQGGDLDPGATLKPAEAPDLNLLTHVEDGRLWLLLPNRNLVKDEDSFEQTMSIDLGGSDAAVVEALQNAVWRLGRAEKLVRTAAVHSRPASSDLIVEARLFRESERAADPRTGCIDRSENPLSEEVKARLRSLSAAAGPAAVGNCDVIRVTVANKSESDDYFLGGFYVDARGGVAVLLADGAEEAASTCVYSLPRKQDQQLSFEMQLTTWMDGQPAPTGLERLILLAVKRDASGLAPNLCLLGQESLARAVETRDADTKRGEESDLDRLIGDIAGTRAYGGSMKVQAAPKVAMETYMLELNVAP
jgi:hypothetical protein